MIEPAESQKLDIEKAFKLPKEHRYFNISVLWIFYYKKVIQLLYHIKIRHEFVTFLSLACGIAGGLFLLEPGYKSLVASALFVHLKDVFDASDGSLARLRGQTNRIARFMDSIFDFLAITWLLAALGLRTYPAAGIRSLALGAIAWISIFIQCSYFNFYLVSYMRLFGRTNVRTDERLKKEDLELYPVKWKRYVLIYLQKVYGIVYGWQDRAVSRLDRWSLKRVWGVKPEELSSKDLRDWYGDKRLMSLNSPLCFGTHLFVFILMALLSRPEYFYYFVIFAGNVFLLINVLYREVRMNKKKALLYRT